MNLTKTEYHKLRRHHYNMEQCVLLLCELPGIHKTLPETLRLIAKDIWKILMECEVVND